MPSFESHDSFTANGLAAVNLANLNPEDTTCSICLDPYQCAPNFENPKRLPCGHVLGEVCILTWMEASNTCPMCRSELFALSTELANDDEGTGGYGGANLYAVSPVSLDPGFWNDEDDWEGAWLRSLGVDDVYVPLGLDDDPLGPVSVSRSEADLSSLDLSSNVSDVPLSETEYHGEDSYQHFSGLYMTVGPTNGFTPTIVTRTLILEETEVEYHI